MAKAKSKSRRSNLSAPRSFWAYQWMVVRVVVLASGVAIIVFFRNFLGNIIFETIGFGLILWLAWVAAIVFMLWKRRWDILLARWNVWLGSIILAIAIWGILALFHPSGFTIGDVEFAKVSLGGNTGKYLIGNQGVGVPPSVRLTLLTLVGVALVAPNHSFRFLKLLGQAARTAGLVILTGASRLLAGLGHALAGLYQNYPPHRLLIGPIIALSHWLRSRPAARPKTSKETLPFDLDVNRLETEPETIAEKRPPRQTAFVIEEKTETPPKTKRPVPDTDVAGKGELPPIDLLDKVTDTQFTEADNEQRARLLERALDSYGVEAKVVQINPGPSVTQFGVEPGWDRKYKRVVERDQQGKIKLDKDGVPTESKKEVSRTRVKVERITSLSNNLALALAVHSIRIEAPVPGKPLVGIEVPNTDTALVLLKSVIESPAFQKTRSKSKLALALGKGAAGEAVAADLSKMPHLLIAGTTGSGKTVFLNSIITCLLMHNRPQDLRLILIDPKRVELVQFENIPHLISPVVKEVDKAVDSLRRVIREMDNRYKEFAAVGVRNIEGYNRSPLITEPLPHLVVIVDELNQLMMTAAEVVETSICRLAQLSRATGIHLIVATQRPSVDVVTGLIKANFPTRIAFTVPSLMDSRTILDSGGAEKLLGMGDMLYLPSDVATPKRLRGCFLSEQEIDRVVKFWKQPQDTYEPQAEDSVAKAFSSLEINEITDEDTMLPAARRLAKESSHISTSLIQRRLHVGYPRAARIMDSLERDGLISRSEPGGPAEVIESYEEEE